MAEVWWGRDLTGRFASRPFYSHNYIESRAEEVLKRYADASGTSVTYPLDDDTLETLVDFLTETFDQSADTSSYGLDIDGFTVFKRNEKPSVVLNQDLSDPRYRARRRFTIAHELGHVVLHQPLYDRDDKQLDLLVQEEPVPVYCAKRDIDRSVDWCEWQAGYFAGALLMPKRLVHERLHKEDAALLDPARLGSAAAERVAHTASRLFDISYDAARVRLSALGLIIPVTAQLLGEETA